MNCRLQFYLILILLSFGQLVNSDGITVRDGGYKGVVVAFSKELTEDEGVQLIPQIQELFKSASPALHLATQRFFFSEITVLLPREWDRNKFAKVLDSSRESIENAAFLVVPQKVGVDTDPSVLQYGGCKVKGQRIYVSRSFLEEKDNLKVRTLRLISEWARYRYGVFEEHGHLNSLLYPLYYSTPGKQNGVVQLNSCTNKNIHLEAKNISDESPCDATVNYQNGLPKDETCRLTPSNQNEGLVSSIMFSTNIDSINKFCDTEVGTRHKSDSPTRQNSFCHGDSITTVLNESPDYKNGSANLANTETTFRIVQENKFQIAFLFDRGNNMERVFESAGDSLKKFIEGESIPLGSKAYIYMYDRRTEGTDEPNWRDIQSPKDRIELSNKILSRDGIAGESNLDRVLQAFNDKVFLLDKPSITMVTITSGSLKENQDLLEKRLLQYPNIRMHLIRFLHENEKDDLPSSLHDIIRENGGMLVNIPWKGSSNNLTSLEMVTQFEDALHNALEKDTRITEVHREVIEVGSAKREVHFTLANQTEEINMANICLSQIKKGVPTVAKTSLVLTLGENTYKYDQQDDQVTLKEFRHVIYTKYCFEVARGKLTAKGSLSFDLNPNSDFTDALIISVSLNDTVKGVKLSGWSRWVDTSNKSLGLVIYAHLRHDYQPIRGAVVKASIWHPEKASDSNLIETELFDNGLGDPDISEGDGIYSRYFTSFSKDGSYIISLSANDNDGDASTTKEKEGTSKITNENVRTSRSTNENEQVSKSTNKNESYTNLTNYNEATAKKSLDVFQRFAPMAMTFQVTWEVGDRDFIPPNRVLDLRADWVKDKRVNLTWTAPGDDYDTKRSTGDPQASEYLVKYFEQMTDARTRFEQTGTNATIWKAEGKPLKPLPFGQVQKFPVKLEDSDKGGEFFFALISIDEAGNESPVSNVARVYLHTPQDEQVTTVVPNNETVIDVIGMQYSPEQIGLISGLSVTGFLVLLAIVFVVFVIWRRKKKSQSNESLNTNAAPIVTVFGGTQTNPNFESKDISAPIQSWPAETLLKHYDRVQEAKQRNDPRPMLNVSDLLESISDSGSVYTRNSIYEAYDGKDENINNQSQDYSRRNGLPQRVTEV